MPKPKWRLWAAGSGLVAVVAVAVFVGAAAATTGAPVFYDARYPAPASTGPGEYDVNAGTDAPQAPADGAAEEAGTRGGTDPATPRPTQPAPSAPPSAAPGTPAPTPGPTPAPTDEPAPPTADDEASEPPAPGGPPTDGTRPIEPPTPDEQETWLAFQQLVRECMADAGHEYLYWEWWNPAPDASNRFPAMPDDLTPEQYAAWELALHGETGSGDAYRWEDGGCWGAAVHATGGTR